MITCSSVCVLYITDLQIKIKKKNKISHPFIALIFADVPEKHYMKKRYHLHESILIPHLLKMDSIFTSYYFPFDGN